MGELLGPLDGVVQRVETHLGEVGRQDMTADPQHRHGPDDPDAAEEGRRRRHDRAAQRADGAGAALSGQVRAGVVELDESRHQAVDGEGDEQGDEDQHDDAPHGGLPLDLGQGQQHDLGGQNEVRGDGLTDDLGLVDRAGLLLGVSSAAEALQDLLPALEAQVGAADDERHRQEPRRHGRQQQADRQDDEELVAQRAQRDLLDDRQLPVRGDAGDVLGGGGDVVDGGRRDLRRGLDGHGGRVVNGGQRQLGERGDVVEKGEEA